VFAEHLPQAAAYALVASAVCLASAAVLLIMKRSSPARSVLIVVALAALAGFNHYRIRWLRPDNDIARLALPNATPIEVEGRVSGVVNRGVRRPWYGRQTENTSFALVVRSVWSGDRGFPSSGRLRVFVEGWPADLGTGDRVSVQGLTFPLSPPTNPGQFDYARLGARNGDSGSLIVRRPEHLRILGKAPWYAPASAAAALRARAVGTIERMIPSERYRALARCLLVGDQSMLSPDERDRLARAGVYHFVVVSGLHLGVVVALLWLPLLLLGVTEGTRFTLTAFAVVAYTLVTGLRPPVVRAALMVLAGCGAILAHRRADAPSAVALAALVILGVRPAELFNPGFQLSFLAVVSLIWLTPALSVWLRGRPPVDPLAAFLYRRSRMVSLRRWFARPLAASLAVWLGLTPLLVYHFNLLTFGSIIGNLLLVPVLFGVLAVGLPGTALAALAPAAAPFVGGILSGVLWVFVAVGDALNRAEFLSFYLPQIGFGALLLSYGAVLLLLAAMKGWMRPRAALAVAAACVVVSSVSLTDRAIDVPELTVLDVRHGLSVIVRAPPGRVVVLDAGSWSWMDTGREITAPALWSMGIARLDRLVLSHSHLDHIQGAPALIRRMRPRRILVNADFRDLACGRLLLDDYCKAGAVSVVERGAPVLKTGDFEARVIFPPAGFKAAKTNDGSLAVMCRFGERRALLLADQEEPALAWLLANEDVRCDLVVLPHHGRVKGEWLEKLLAASGAGQAVISGAGPDAVRETIGILDRRRVRWWATFRDGALTVKMTPEGLTVEPFEQKPLRLWADAP